MENINNKNFEHRPIKELLTIVKRDFKSYDDAGLIDEGSLIKTIMYCNDKLGINIREIRQVCIQIQNFKGRLPLDFEKLYFATALVATNTVLNKWRNPFSNNFDADVIYQADVDRGTFGCTDCYGVTINRLETTTVHNINTWIPLHVDQASTPFCHLECPNTRRTGKYSVHINGDTIETPFKSGELYIMYIGTMQDGDGNLMFPFHPMITPYYEWMLKEKVCMDAVFNSDDPRAPDKLALAQRERGKAWLEAYDMTTSKAFGEYVNMQRKKELGWYNQYFKYFK